MIGDAAKSAAPVTVTGIGGWAAVRLGAIEAAVFCGALATLAVIVALVVREIRAEDNPRTRVRLKRDQ